MADYGGWAGKILRVDLSTGKITAEDTMQYKDYLGGDGLGYKVLWDEVPANVKAFDPENRLIFGIGPLTGSGAPLSGRTATISRWPVDPDELPAWGNIGGHWGAQLKYAGWDGIIVQGKADTPVWLYINDDKVELRDARGLWGNGINRTTADICAEVGKDVNVLAIGQAGEHMARTATVCCDRSHAGGGVGGIMGSKNLKAIAIRGTGAVKLAVDAKTWKELNIAHLQLLGANSGGMVPRDPQPWAEYYGSTRWTARKGLFWGAARPPIETGECTADDLNRISLRTHKGVLDHGYIMGEKYTVRQSGCHSCPIRCHIVTDIAGLEKYGVPRYQSNTCSSNSFGKRYFTTIKANTEAQIEASQLGQYLLQDYGIFNDYGMMSYDFMYLCESGMWAEILDPKEYESIPWKLQEEGNPAFLLDITRRWAYREGLMGEILSEGPGFLERRYPQVAEYHNTQEHSHAWKRGHALHHSRESDGQVGALINILYNRDAQCHTHTNFLGCGFPLELQQEIAAEIFGDTSAVMGDPYTPITPARAKFAAMSIIYLELHNSLTACNYTLPTWASPRKDRNYRGDVDMETKMYAAVTGDNIERAELEQKGRHILALQRLLNARYMGTTDLRNQHDTIPDWVFDDPADQVAFTPGSEKMDRDDMELAKDLFYAELGLEPETGMPTAALLAEMGVDASELQAKA